jgi:transposase
MPTLTDEQRLLVGMMCKNGVKRATIAKRFGVTKSVIQYTWKLWKQEVLEATGRKAKARPVSRKGDGAGVLKRRRKAS